ncbi:hypothetical protein DFJ73DRAFT_883086 [Zopfochytrium polystomum]|nr:hypothetical protein DFJ73DRAFT_883086 [Zopfochytrium polystomum]
MDDSSSPAAAAAAASALSIRIDTAAAASSNPTTNAASNGKGLPLHEDGIALMAAHDGVDGDRKGLGAAAATAGPSAAARREILAFKKNYLLVYSLVMFSDWLQGAYLYPLYKAYGYDLNEIAVLFVVGFLASAVFGTVIGAIADNVGRRKMSLAFCVIYALSCWTKLFSNYQMLLLGRVFGGIGTSLLFSVFEAWMVSEHRSRGFPSEELGDIFAWSTFANGLVAILAGVVANSLVDFFGLTAPFIFATAVLILTFFVISGSWAENYGSTDPRNQASLKEGVLLVWRDKHILCVGIMQVLFESAMYAMVFLWSPTLDNVKPASIEKLPFGLIFSALMVSIMGGSYVFRMLLQRGWTEERIAVVTFGAAAGAIVVPFLFRDLFMCILAFCLFEACCGLYFPAIGTLRGKYIPEATRSTVMNVVRFPENVIVVGILLKVNDSDGGHEGDAVYYLICCVLILLGMWASVALGSGPSAGVRRS